MCTTISKIDGVFFRFNQMVEKKITFMIKEKETLNIIFGKTYCKFNQNNTFCMSFHNV